MPRSGHTTYHASPHLTPIMSPQTHHLNLHSSPHAHRLISITSPHSHHLTPITLSPSPHLHPSSCLHHLTSHPSPLHTHHLNSHRIEWQCITSHRIPPDHIELYHVRYPRVECIATLPWPTTSYHVGSHCVTERGSADCFLLFRRQEQIDGLVERKGQLKGQLKEVQEQLDSVNEAHRYENVESLLIQPIAVAWFVTKPWRLSLIETLFSNVNRYILLPTRFWSLSRGRFHTEAWRHLTQL